MGLTSFIQRIAGYFGEVESTIAPGRPVVLFNDAQFELEDLDDVALNGTTADPGIAGQATKISLRSGGAANVPSARVVATTAPLRIDGGASADLSANRTLSIAAATTGAAGSMSSTDKAKLDGLTPGAAVASVSGTAPIVSSGGTTPAISISAASGASAGSMSIANFDKLAAVEAGAINALAGAGMTRTGSTLDIVAANSSITVNANSIQLLAAYKTLLDGATATATVSTLVERGASSEVAVGQATMTALRMTGTGSAIINGSCLSYAPATVTTATTIVLSGKTGANIKDIVLTDNATFDPPSDFDDGTEIEVIVEHGGGGPYTATWDAVFVFSAGIVGTLVSNSAGEVDVFRHRKRGAYWFCWSHTSHVKP